VLNNKGKEVVVMAKSKGNNRGKMASGVNPQGYGQDAELTENPKSELENIAKRKNTK